MKKIIMAVAAIAMAASMFAADVAAGTKIAGSIFEYGTDKSISVLKQTNDSHSYANPNFALNIADDKAGGTFKITTDGGTAPSLADQTIWFKPLDMLKITVGGYDVALNKEQIDWTESNTDLGGEGFLVSLDLSGFALDVGLNPGDGAFWLTKPEKGDASIQNLFIKAAYNADFGSVGAYFAMNKQNKGWGSHREHYDYAGSTEKKSFEFDAATGEIKSKTDYPSNPNTKGIDIGAGYKGAFGPVSAFVNAIAYMYDGSMKWIRPEIYVSGGVDALGFSLFAAPTIFLDDHLYQDRQWVCADKTVNENSKAKLEIVAKVSYGMGGITPYAYFKSQDLLMKAKGAYSWDDAGLMTFKIGATGGVGLMGWNTWVQIDAGASGSHDKVKVSVPFELTVSF